jgi:GT2 family glycosyltransferase
MADSPPPAQVPIAPVPAGAARPYWSVMIPTFHCADLLKDALASVLAQDPGPERMQIEVVDDASTRDDPRAVTEEVGRGRVSFFRQPENRGATENFNTCLRRSRGEVIHILHGDDAVGPGFYDAMEDVLGRWSEAGAAVGPYAVRKDGNREERLVSPTDGGAGPMPGFRERLLVRQLVQFASVVVRRRTYERLGGFDPRLVHAGDWEMWQRIAVFSEFVHAPAATAYYRIHADSDTSRLARRARNIDDRLAAIELVRSYLPPGVGDGCSRRARVALALDAARQARHFRRRGDREGTGNSARAALRCSRSLRVLLHLARLAFVRASRKGAGIA